MRYLITGASGLIGSSLTRILRESGHEVASLSRRPHPDDPTSFAWNPDAGDIDFRAFTGCDVVVHLAGEDVSKRWTTARMQAIRDSRVDGTTLLAETIAKLDQKPRVLLSASAVGYYGSRGDELLTEDSASGNTFLAEVCREWEAATQPAADAGVRVVNLRIGVVLAKEGGAIGKMLPIYKLGLGGKIGDGSAWMPWISIDDVVGAFLFAADNEQLSGPVNVTAPQPVTNAEFTRELARALKRPAFFSVPVFALKLMFGQQAKGMMLTSSRTVPSRLTESGYQFTHAELSEALKAVL